MTEPVTLPEARAQVNIIDDADTTFDSFLTSLSLRHEPMSNA